MKRRVIITITGFLTFFVLFSCRKDNVTPTPQVPQETIATNQWIYDNMNQYYYWNAQMPTGIDNTKETDPKAYFYKLLYQSDKWSSITEDYKSLSAELSGDPVTMGYYPGFFLVGSNKIVIAVGYVYPGSAAAVAGLKRGDIILSINNTVLDTTNYYTLYSGTNYSVQLGALKGTTLESTGRSLTMTAKLTSTDPAIFDTVFNVGGTKIGYLVYTEFISGGNNTYIRSMDNIFNSFKAAGVSELIVDLRYNPGGDISAAVHLASNIAPSTATTSNQVMVNLQYNSNLQQYIQSNQMTDYLYFKFENPSSNLNLKRVFFLTTSRTASASELTITGLKPYMNVVEIGEPTYGKYVGSWVIPDDKQAWAIMPIVLKYANAQGYTDFVNGLTPDYKLDDDLFTAVQFGDMTDPLVAKAVQLITGTSVTSKSAKIAYPGIFRKIVPPEKRNLYFPSMPMKAPGKYPVR